MKFKQYIIENENPNDIINLLHKNCSDYFKYIRYGVKSFRGTKKNISIYKKFTPRTDRTSLSTPKHTHKYLNKLFKEKFGWNVRSEGVFVSSYLDAIYQYGEPYYFYPSNGFKVIYSNNITDLYLDIKYEHSGKFSDLLSKDYLLSKDPFDKDNIKKLSDELMSYFNTGGPQDINKALQTFNEVVFKCKFYYLVDLNFVTDHFDEIYK